MKALRASEPSGDHPQARSVCVAAALALACVLGAGRAAAVDMGTVLGANFTVPANNSVWTVAATGPGPSANLTTDTDNLGDVAVKLNGAAIPFYAGFTFGIARTNAPPGGALASFRTVEAYPGGTGDSETWLSITQMGTAATEGNSEVAVAHFPYAAGWIGATVNGSGTLLGGNGVLQADSVSLGSGFCAVDLHASNTDGLVFASGGANQDNLAMTCYDSALGRWEVRVMDNQQDYGSAESANVSFLYIPFSATGLIGGHIDVTGSGATPFAGQSAGTYSVQRTATGAFRLTVPGVTPHNAVLLLGTGDDTADPQDNFFTYDRDGDAFVIHCHDLPGAGAEDADFRFAVVPIPPPPPTVGVVDAVPAVWTVTRTTPYPYNLNQPGANAGDPYVKVDSQPVPYGRRGIVLAVTGGTSGAPADNLANPTGPDTAAENLGGTFVSTVDLPNGSEQSAACNILLLPYAGGWRGAYVAGATGAIDGGGRWGYGVTQSQIARVGAGIYELTGLAGPAAVSVFAVGNQNNQDHVVNVSYAAGTARWTVRNVDEDGAAAADGNFCFAVVDHSRAGVFCGEVDADGTATLAVTNASAALAAAGGATVVKIGTGLWDLTIGDGARITPTTAVLFVGSGQTAGVPNDNAWMAGSNGANVFRVKSLDLPGESTFEDADFRFLILPLDTTPAAEPATAAAGVTAADVTPGGMRISWAHGSGNAVLVVVRENGAPRAPVDGWVYAADARFGAGASLGAGSYVVYNGSGSSVDITGLKDGVSYTIQVFAYNGQSGTENYRLTDAPAVSQTTVDIPSGTVIKFH